MSEPEVKLVDTKGFSINLPFVGAPVTIRTEGDEVVINVRLRVRPRDKMMNIDFDVSAGGDGASVPRFNKDAAADIRRNSGAIPLPAGCRPIFPFVNQPTVLDSRNGRRVAVGVAPHRRG